MTGVVSVWRTRFAALGIDGLKDKPRPGAKPIYTETTGKRILAVLDQPVPKGRARWTCELIAEALGDVDVNYVRRFLRSQKIDLAGRKSWCESVMSKTCLRHGAQVEIALTNGRMMKVDECIDPAALALLVAALDGGAR